MRCEVCEKLCPYCYVDNYFDNKIETLQKENAKLRECVELGLERNYKEIGKHGDGCICSGCNWQLKARETLKELEGGE